MKQFYARDVLARPVSSGLSLVSHTLQAMHPLCRPQQLPRLLQLPGQPGMGSVGQCLPRQGRQAQLSKGALGRCLVWAMAIHVARAQRDRLCYTGSIAVKGGRVSDDSQSMHMG